MSSVLTVSGLNSYISFKLKSDDKLKGIMIEGEISNFVRHFKSGHMYFTLKDDKSCVKCVMFSSNAIRLKFIPENGMRVVIYGNVEVYERDGVYQIYAFDMAPAGIGQLYLAYEQLKQKLLNEGLFDERYKKNLPQYPHKIGIVTSKDGAGLADMLNIISRRYPVCEITLYPSLVQGSLSAKSLTQSLIIADNDNNDVIIIGRGGGSFEDLFSFNDEMLARTVFDCNTPIVSAVGHETDFTICDFVADLRAETPSAAAQLVTPDLLDIKKALNNYIANLSKILEKKLQLENSMLDNKLDRLKKCAPYQKYQDNYKAFENSFQALHNSYTRYLSLCESQYSGKIAMLDSLSPLNILKRGYSLCYKDEKLIKSSGELNKNDTVTIKMSDGNVIAVVN